MARASGLELAGGKANNTAMIASSRGTGELIAAAVRSGARRSIIGVGVDLVITGDMESFNGKGRESRRLVGDVTLTEHDCHADRRWPDGVAYASWWIDLHIKGGINNREAPVERENIDKRYSDYIRVVPFNIPLRAYYSRNVENLWMTGRLLSATHVALGPVRVQLSLAA